MDINSLTNSNDGTFFDVNFLNLIESYHSVLKQNVKVIPITEFQSYKFEGDFYGILNDNLIPKKYHFIIARLNGIANSTDYDGKLKIFIVPDFTEIERLKNIFNTKTVW